MKLVILYDNNITDEYYEYIRDTLKRYNISEFRQQYCWYMLDIDADYETQLNQLFQKDCLVYCFAKISDEIREILEEVIEAEENDYTIVDGFTAQIRWRKCTLRVFEPIYCRLMYSNTLVFNNFAKTFDISL